MKVLMSKVLGGERIRTSTVKGDCEGLPVLGESFVIIADAIQPGAMARRVNTSAVKGIEYELDGTITITTENSVYRLTVLEET